MISLLLAIASVPPLSITFLADDPAAPAASFTVVDDDANGGRARGLEGVVLGAKSLVVSRKDVGVARAADLFPRAPGPDSLEVADDGAILLTVTALGPWQSALKADRRGSLRGTGLMVADANDLRLEVSPPSALCVHVGCEYTARARLVGTRVSVVGRAIVTRGKAPAVVVREGDGLSRATGLYPLSSKRACGRVLPTRMVSLGESDLTLALKQESCGARTSAVYEGARVGARGPRAVRALLLEIK